MAIIKANAQCLLRRRSRSSRASPFRSADWAACSPPARWRQRFRRWAGAASCGYCAPCPRPRRSGSCSRCLTGAQQDPTSRPSSASWLLSCARRCSGATRPRWPCSRSSTSPTSAFGRDRGCATWPATIPKAARTSCSRTLAMMAGALVVGAAASRSKAVGLPPMLVTLACTAGQVVAQIGLALRPTAVLAVGGLWMLFAFCVAGATAGYISVGQMFPPEQTARCDRGQHAHARRGLRAAGRRRLGARLVAAHRLGRLGPRGYSAALAVSLAVQLFVALRLLRGKRLEFSA